MLNNTNISSGKQTHQRNKYNKCEGTAMSEFEINRRTCLCWNRIRGFVCGKTIGNL
jgi:hypothetical protein